MPGKKNLAELLSTMCPALDPDEYAFLTVNSEQRRRLTVPALMEFHEREGITLVTRRADAEKEGLSFAFPCRLITLTVHSSLEAIGFLAVITQHLAEAQISVNAVSAFYHDHLFVPTEKAELAMQVLRGLAAHTSEPTS